MQDEGIPGGRCTFTQIDLLGDHEYLPGERGVCSVCDDGTPRFTAPEPKLILPGDPDFHL